MSSYPAHDATTETGEFVQIEFIQNNGLAVPTEVRFPFYSNVQSFTFNAAANDKVTGIGKLPSLQS